MKKWIVIALSIIFLLTALLCYLCLITLQEQDSKCYRIGVCVYNSSVRESIIKAAQIEPSVMLLIGEDVRDQNLQIEEINGLIDQDIDALIVNPIDRIAAIHLIDLAANADLPIVLVNTEPLQEDLVRYDRAYYVGSNAQLTGTLCGQIVADLFTKDKTVDLNHDGILQIVLFKGQIGHQDTDVRTAYSLKALRDAGVRYEILSEELANWERRTAQEKMASCIAVFGNRVEAVICNNDSMALGVIDALKAVGYFEGDKTMPVVGVDGIYASSKSAIRNNTLYGTVMNDTVSQGRAAYRLAVLMAHGTTPNEEVFEYPIENGHYVWIPSVIIQGK